VNAAGYPLLPLCRFSEPGVSLAPVALLYTFVPVVPPSPELRPNAFHAGDKIGACHPLCVYPEQPLSLPLSLSDLTALRRVPRNANLHECGDS
jgi:hypothetical protein